MKRFLKTNYFSGSLIFLFLLVTVTSAFQYSPYARRIRPVVGIPVSCTENEIAYDMTGHTPLICTNTGYKILAQVGGAFSGSSLILNGATSGAATIIAPATFTNYQLTLPTNDGDSGQFLQTNGSGVTSWQTASSGEPYLVYTATLTQTGTDAPVATVLRNTTGITFTWARSAEGVYTITADSGTPFVVNKTLPSISINKSWSTQVAYIFSATRTSTTIITVNTGYQTGAGGDSQLNDGTLTETPFEIRIYP